ncbi:MAG: 23S rRNA (pseudouridine(1915)-N(3))-methyltransferase RlmH [candidate division KSB1 bacterium]|nr:23S rRNA (pseudouridine(1915)-N(3))-methyltransferase RlmH [candidate division KSB1 bacterium]MDZ7366347.1 23S rRNA (pseudouridine(1915)-N(3))-methyltransferase RlmH [candidate division KSB1 bacterium]MDZ7404002.1 23S rRNA (pseudouridine(1915)-N(3))-methyltransferase RlmH [candidate division KSB1 bacterium]
MPFFPLQIRLLAVGKLRDPIWTPAVTQYGQRLQNYAKFDLIEVRDAVGKGLPDSAALAEEGKLILRTLEPGNYLIVLDRHGKPFSSEQLAQALQKLIDTGIRTMDFVIGGPIGLDHTIIAKANLRLSLSAMTLPHELARVVLLEQLYRALTILRGEPYHK